MSDAKVWKNLAQFVKYEEKVINENMPVKLVVHYTQPDSQDPQKVWEVGEFADKIKDELAEKVLGLVAGEKMCIHTAKNDKGYSVLVDITSAADAPQRSKNNYKNGGKTYQRDESGVAVAGAWTNAHEAHTMGIVKLKTLDDWQNLAEEILQRKHAQTVKYRAQIKAEAPTTKKDKKEEKEKPMTALEKAKAKMAAAKEDPKEATKTKKSTKDLDKAMDENFEKMEQEAEAQDE